MSESLNDENRPPVPNTRPIAQAAQIVSSFVSRNHVPVADLPTLITKVHATLAEIGRTAIPASPPKPAIPIRKSFGDDYIICLEDGARLTMLKRYLHTHFNMTPEEYRAKWGLPLDYPMVAPAYARLRSAFAKRIGLGTTSSARPKGRPKR